MNEIIDHYPIIFTSSFKYVVSPYPDPNSIKYYEDLLLKNGITTIVRLCEKKYDYSFLEMKGINIIDSPIDDGSFPSDEMIIEWIDIINNEIKKGGIAVHCVSGLGRAPLFVCVGLIAFEKMDPVDTVTYIRKFIPNALNTKQLEYIYKLKIKKMFKNNSHKQCNII